MESRRSTYTSTRKSMLKSLELPTLSTVQAMLGAEFAEVVYKEVPQVLKEPLGLEPLLKGAGDELWTSPSDLLIGKVCLKPPLTSKHIRALTHNGILDIGYDIEKKFWNELEIEKETAMKQQEDHLRAQFAVELRNIGQDVQREEARKCAREIRKLEKQFEERLLRELNALEERLNDDTYLQEQLALQRDQYNSFWQKKLDKEVEKTVKELTSSFLEELENQEHVMMQKFIVISEEMDIHKQFCIHEERIRCKEGMKQIKHQLECKNIANMIYILCMERRKCKREKDDLIAKHEKQVEDLTAVINARHLEVEEYKSNKISLEQKLDLREQCLEKILQQFQKFISYALRASPTQAEFLLNIEKLMMFELTDALEKTESHIKVKPHSPCDGLMDWLSSTGSRTSTEESKSLFIEDYHNCLKELALPLDQRPSSDALPMFYFDDKMYVREDFRNRLSQDLRVSPSECLWNEDVESLMEIFRKMGENESGSKRTIETDKKRGSKRRKKTSTKRKSIGSIEADDELRASVVHFSACSLLSHDKEFRDKITRQQAIPDSVSLSSSLKRQPSLKLGSDTIAINFEEIGKVERGKSLLGTTNSLELIRKRIDENNTGYEKKVETDISKRIDENNTGYEKKVETDIISEKKIEINERDNEKISLRNDAFIDMMPTVPPTESMSSKNNNLFPSILSSKLLFTRDSLILKKEEDLFKEIGSLKGKVIDKRDSFSKTSSYLLHGERKSILKLPSQDTIISSKPLENLPARKNDAIGVQESRLTLAKDSLELIRDSKRNLPDRNLKKSKRKASFDYEQHSKELVIKSELYSDEKKSDVSILRKSVKIEMDLEKNVLPKMYTPIIIIERDQECKPKTKKPSPKSIVVGDKTAKQHLQTTEEFTLERIHSFIELIKDDPDLIGMFTSFNR